MQGCFGDFCKPRNVGSRLRRTKLEIVPVLCLIANGSGTPRLPQGNEELEYAGQKVKTRERKKFPLNTLQHDVTVYAPTNRRGKVLILDAQRREGDGIPLAARA
jgi:hypothetical protein